MTRQELQSKVCMLLGGRAAEWLMLGQLSTGAADNLAKATQIARDMVMRYGMDEGLGSVSFDSNRPLMPGFADGFYPAPPTVSPATQQRLDEAIGHIVAQGLARASAILQANRDLLGRCAHELLSRETLDAPALQKLTAEMRKEKPPQ
jgi:cell division protease FtsH